MKKKRLSFDDWKGISRRKLTMAKVCGGDAALLEIEAVDKPLKWTVGGREYVFCDAGMKWLAYLPEDGAYAVTAVYDACGNLQMWYTDMIAGRGTDPDGVPYYMDLYLDLVILPDGECIIDDREELDAALAGGEITPQQHVLALETCAERMRETDVRRLAAESQRLIAEMTRRES